MEVSTLPYVGICTHCKAMVFVSAPEAITEDIDEIATMIGRGISIERHSVEIVRENFAGGHEDDCPQFTP